MVYCRFMKVISNSSSIFFVIFFHLPNFLPFSIFFLLSSAPPSYFARFLMVWEMEQINITCNNYVFHSSLWSLERSLQYDMWRIRTKMTMSKHYYCHGIYTTLWRWCPSPKCWNLSFVVCSQWEQFTNTRNARIASVNQITINLAECLYKNQSIYYWATPELNNINLQVLFTIRICLYALWNIIYTHIYCRLIVYIPVHATLGMNIPIRETVK